MARGPYRAPRRQLACHKCGNLVDVGHSKRETARCLDCTLVVMVENIEQLRAKKGPYYDRWLLGMLNWVDREVGVEDPSRLA